MRDQPILIAGLPRSGTTWIGEVLSADPNIRYFYEPDNEKVNSYAGFYKRNVHRFPFRITDQPHDDYHQLWKGVFSGLSLKKVDTLAFRLFVRPQVKHLEAEIGRKVGFVYFDQAMKDVDQNACRQPFRYESHPLLNLAANTIINTHLGLSGRRILVKSVHCPLALQWLDSNFSPKIVIALRNPFALYASYRRLFMPDAFRNILAQQELKEFVSERYDIRRFPNGDLTEQAIFQILLVYSILSDQISENTHWHFISHDRLCEEPTTLFHSLYSELGLAWSDEVEALISGLNASGDGFTPKRISKDQPQKWRKELSQKEQTLIEFWVKELRLTNFLENRVVSEDF